MNFRPEEIYIAENAKEYNDAYPMPREVRNKLRMAFKHFHEKKKLKYIKIAESNYDKMV